MFSNYRQYWDLTKPKVVALIVFTALVGMVLAIPGVPSWEQVRAGVLGFLGIWLAASAAAAINQLLDAHIDAQMALRGVRWWWARSSRGRCWCSPAC